MKRFAPLVALLLVVGLSAVACSKSGSNQQQNANGSAAGPVTDSGANGLKDSGAAGPMAGDAVHGKEIFTQNCAGCHGATGVQGGVGPSLRNEKSRKDTTAAIAWIKDPKAPMPKLYPSPLSEKDVADVAAYVESL